MEFQNLPLDLRLKIMSFNCDDVDYIRYHNILRHPFPKYETLKKKNFTFGLSLNDYRVSEIELYYQLKEFYSYSYIFEIHNMFLKGYFLNSYKCEELETLLMLYHNEMRCAISVIPMETDFLLKYFEELHMFNDTSDDDDNDDNESVISLE